jgi:hypothetical protein
MSDGLPTTNWTMLDRTRGDGPASRAAMAQFVERYLVPLRRHVVIRFPQLEQEAEDLVHEFIASKVLERSLLDRADRRRGRFRNFLLTALDNFVRDARRGHGRRAAAGGDELPEAWTPPAQHDLVVAEWAKAVVRRAAEIMKAWCDRSRKPNVWRAFELRALRPAFDGTDPISYRELVRELELPSATQAYNLWQAATRAYARSLAQAIGEYDPGVEDLRAEVRELRDTLARAAGGAT